MGRSGWFSHRLLVALGVGAVLGSALLAAAAPPALQGFERDWSPAARAAAQESIFDRASAEDDVEFAGVEVRRSGNDDERWVCGSFAVRDEEGSLGPFRDFWITVARVPGTWSDIHEVRVNRFGRGGFLDRNSALFRACFADGGTG